MLLPPLKKRVAGTRTKETRDVEAAAAVEPVLFKREKVVGAVAEAMIGGLKLLILLGGTRTAVELSGLSREERGERGWVCNYTKVCGWEMGLI